MQPNPGGPRLWGFGRCLVLGLMGIVVNCGGLVAGAADISGAAGGSGQTAGSNRYNLILVSLTNTRADHLGCYGYSRATSPNIDRLARHGILFRNAFTHASWTLPAVISMFTSTYPFMHGMMNREQAQPLSPAVPTFIDVLRTNGYRTAAFVGSRDYAARFGHTSRFELVYDPVRNPDQEDWKSYGVLENTLPPARAWLQRNHEKPFVLLVQGYDTHCPFAVPKANPRFDPGYRGDIDFTKCYWTFEKTKPLSVRTRAGRYEDIYLLKTKPTEGDNFDVRFNPEDIRHMVALYDGEIANADALIGKLLDDVKALGLEQRTIIVFYADHGDMFGKHGRFMRGGPLRGTFYDDVLRIPLILQHPGLKAGTVDAQAEFLDLGPTLLDLLGFANQIPATFRGRSLRPILTGGATTNRNVFAGAAFTPAERNPFFPYESVIYAVRNPRWKLIYERLKYPAGPQESLELYNVGADPEELKNVVDGNPAVVTELKGALVRWLDSIEAGSFKPSW